MLTALDLAAAGNKVFLVVDATASRSSPDKEIALQRMVAAGITLVTREMVFFELLRTAGTPPIQGLQQKISALMNKNLSRSAGLDPIAFSAGLTYSKKRPIFASTAQCGNGLGLWSRPANI